MTITTTEVQSLRNELELMTERLEESVSAQARLMAEDAGWEKLTRDHQSTMTVDGRRRLSAQCRAAAAVNPILKRGLAVRAGYVWGLGVGVTMGDERLNTIIQEFLDDDETRGQLTGHQAHLGLETRIGVDGNAFIVLFTDPLTGRVRPRVADFHEVGEIFTDPEDKATPWFYQRTYQVQDTPGATPRTVTVWHPDIRYKPATRHRWVQVEGSRDRQEIRWDAPMVHVHDNGAPGEGWGIPDAFAAMDWARKHSGFLTDWANLTKALSRIAWRVSSDSKTGAARMRAAMSGAQSQGEAGGTIGVTDGMSVEAVPKTGATIDSESGRPLAAQVAAALGVPVTTLLADPGQTGARAVAETLNKPTVLEMQNRRELWQEAFRVILNHVIDSAALAVGNPHGLRGTGVRDGNRLTVDIQGADRAITFDWPPLDEEETSSRVRAIVDAFSTGRVPDDVLMRLLLRALKVRDVDAVVDEWTVDGVYQDPHVGTAAMQDHGDTPGGDYR